MRERKRKRERKRERKGGKEGRRLGNETAPHCRDALHGRGDTAPRLQGLILIFLRTGVLVAPVAVERFKWMLAVEGRLQFLIVRLLLLGIAILAT